VRLADWFINPVGLLSGDTGENGFQVMRLAPGDTERLDGIVGADDELVDAGAFAKLDSDSVAVFE
jgi:hypothetical protein